jgi:hypothetical protein
LVVVVAAGLVVLGLLVPSELVLVVLGLLVLPGLVVVVAAGLVVLGLVVLPELPVVPVPVPVFTVVLVVPWSSAVPVVVPVLVGPEAATESVEPATSALVTSPGVAETAADMVDTWLYWSSAATLNS